jgi:hypothetical protein
MIAARRVPYPVPVRVMGWNMRRSRMDRRRAVHAKRIVINSCVIEDVIIRDR